MYKNSARNSAGMVPTKPSLNKKVFLKALMG